MKVQVYVRLMAQHDPSGNPQRVIIVKEIDTDNPHFSGTRIGVLDEEYEGVSIAKRLFPSAIEVGQYDISKSEYHHWIKVGKTDEKHRELTLLENRLTIANADRKLAVDLDRISMAVGYDKDIVQCEKRIAKLKKELGFS